MLGNEYIPDSYKTLIIRIGTIIKNTEIVKFVPDHLKTKTMCESKVKMYSCCL